MPFQMKNPLNQLEIPDSWDSATAFAKWYVETAGMPMAIPFDAEVLLLENATAISLFRHNRFQVELYLVHPNTTVDSHAHPGVETVLMFLAGGNFGSKLPNGVSSLWGRCDEPVYDLEQHGKTPFNNFKGHALMTFEMWDEGLEVTSDALRWKGDLPGPRNAELIRRAYPDAYVTDSYADVTRTKS